MQNDKLSQELALWIVRLNCDDPVLRQQAQQDFHKWQQAHPEAYQKMSQMQAFSDQLKHLPNSHHLSTRIVNKSFVIAQDSEKKIIHLFRPLSLFIVGLSLGIGLYLATPWPYYFADYRTQTGQTQQLILSDGTHITLGAKSAFNLKFDDKQRQIELLQGDLYIDVAKDLRPLIIKTTQAEFKALGTQFIIYGGVQQSELKMLQSKVQVTPIAARDEHTTWIVTKGEQAIVTQYGVQTVEQINPQLVQRSWQHDLILSENLPLSQLLDRLRLYHDEYLIFNRNSLNQLKISGVIDAKQDMAKTLALIQAQYPSLQIKRLGTVLYYLSLDSTHLYPDA